MIESLTAQQLVKPKQAEWASILGHKSKPWNQGASSNMEGVLRNRDLSPQPISNKIAPGSFDNLPNSGLSKQIRDKSLKFIQSRRQQQSNDYTKQKILTNSRPAGKVGFVTGAGVLTSSHSNSNNIFGGS